MDNNLFLENFPSEVEDLDLRQARASDESDQERIAQYLGEGVRIRQLTKQLRNFLNERMLNYVNSYQAAYERFQGEVDESTDDQFIDKVRELQESSAKDGAHKDQIESLNKGHRDKSFCSAERRQLCTETQEVHLLLRLIFDAWRWQMQISKNERQRREDLRVWCKLVCQAWSLKMLSLDFNKQQRKIRSKRAVVLKSLTSQVEARDKDSEMLLNIIAFEAWHDQASLARLRRAEDLASKSKFLKSCNKDAMIKVLETQIEKRLAECDSLLVSIVFETWISLWGVSRMRQLRRKLRGTRDLVRTSVEHHIDARVLEGVELLQRLAWEAWRGEREVADEKLRVKDVEKRRKVRSVLASIGTQRIDQYCAGVLSELFVSWEFLVSSAKFVQVLKSMEITETKLKYLGDMKTSWLSQVAHDHDLKRISRGVFWWNWTCQGCDGGSRDNPPLVYRCRQGCKFNLCSLCYAAFQASQLPSHHPDLAKEIVINVDTKFPTRRLSTVGSPSQPDLASVRTEVSKRLKEAGKDSE